MLTQFAKRAADSGTWRHLLFAAATLLAVGFAGYHFGTFDQTLLLPLLRRAMDPTLYAADPFSALGAQHFSYFWRPFELVRNARSLEDILFAAHLAATYLTFWSAWSRSRTLFEKPESAVLGVVALALPHVGWAGFPVIEFSLLNRTVVLPFLLWALTLFLRGHYRWAFLLLGALYNLHIISVDFVLAMFLFDSVLEWRKIGWANIALGLAAFLAAALPILVWKAGGPPLDFSVRPEWLATVARGALSNLYFPFTPNASILLATAAGLGALLMYVLARQRTSGREHDRTVDYFVGAIVIMLLIAVLSARYLPVTILIQLQLMRAGLLALIFAYVYWANFLVEQRSRGMLGRGDLVPLASGYGLSVFPFAVVLSWALWHLVRKLPWGRAVTVILTLAGFGVSVGYFVANGLWQPGVYVGPHQTDWYRAQIWARDHTPVEAVFITPPQIYGLYESGWRVFSERSTVVVLSDLIDIAFSPNYLPVWQPRFEAVAPGALARFRGDFFENQRITAKAYDSLGEDGFRRIAARYNADYLVVEQPHTYSFPLVYENPGYRIYRLPRAEVANR